MNDIRLPGPPLTRDSAISLLLSHNVTVGIGIEEPWSARNTRFDVAWVSIVQLAYYEIYCTVAYKLLFRPLWKYMANSINQKP